MDCRNTSVSTKKKSEPHLSKRLSNISFKNQLKYDEVYPLNRLWLSYIKNLLGITSFTNIPRSPDHPNWENINQQLMKADFHGANITIYKSRCASLVGLTGIVVQDTKKTFKICGKDNYIRSISITITFLCSLNHAISCTHYNTYLFYYYCYYYL
jgi:ribonuclease P protein subunit POP4